MPLREEREGVRLQSPWKDSNEREHALVRLGMAVAAVLIGIPVYALSDDVSVIKRLLPVGIGYVLYSALIVWLTGRSAALNEKRLALTTIFDPMLLGAVLYFGGKPAVPFLWGYFWYIVGAAGRYGRTWLLVSTAASMVSLGLVIAAEPYWNREWVFGIGLILAFVGTAIYLSVLLGRLASLNLQLKEMATHDPLTGLATRTLLDEFLANTISRCDRERIPAALLVIDLDGFKPINDNFGHRVGDKLLQRFAREVERNLRGHDLFARVGGDEFVIMLNDANARESVTRVSTMVLETLDAIDMIDGHRIDVSASVGIVIYPLTGQRKLASANELLDLADAAMYEAKRKGGRCVCHSSREVGGTVAATQ